MQMGLSILNFGFISGAAAPGVYWISLDAVAKNKFHAPHKNRGPIIQSVGDRRRPWYLRTFFKVEKIQDYNQIDCMVYSYLYIFNYMQQCPCWEDIGHSSGQ
jgi:hypothetical protein